MDRRLCFGISRDELARSRRHSERYRNRLFARSGDTDGDLEFFYYVAVSVDKGCDGIGRIGVGLDCKTTISDGRSLGKRRRSGRSGFRPRCRERAGVVFEIGRQSVGRRGVIYSRYVIETSVREYPAREEVGIGKETGGVKLRQRVESLGIDPEKVFIDDDRERALGGHFRAETGGRGDGDYLISDFDFVEIESSGERLNVDLVNDVSRHYDEHVLRTRLDLGRERVVARSEELKSGYRVFQSLEESFNVSLGAQSGNAGLGIVAVGVDLAENVKTLSPDIALGRGVKGVILLGHKLLDAGERKKSGLGLFERYAYIVFFLEVDRVKHIDDVGLVALESGRAGVVEIVPVKEFDIHILDGKAGLELFAEERRKGIVGALENGRVSVALYDFHYSSDELVKGLIRERGKASDSRLVEIAAELSHKDGRALDRGVDYIKGVN